MIVFLIDGDNPRTFGLSVASALRSKSSRLSSEERGVVGVGSGTAIVHECSSESTVVYASLSELFGDKTSRKSTRWGR